MALVAVEKARELEREKIVRALVVREYTLKDYNNPEREADKRMEQFKAEPGKIAKLAELAPKRDAELTIAEQAKEASERNRGYDSGPTGPR